ncbi:hypothetical protein Glove_168g205 [Diversispora epigaea]|uniref:Uncharacterized protein n=1 Tax=Diversispora epigaea TaxID=1348612 RepID=A0A397ISX5_9GLOM|nr:hypothetical protein Glove_168g205 [Diversispora epigaea]
MYACTDHTKTIYPTDCPASETTTTVTSQTITTTNDFTTTTSITTKQTHQDCLCKPPVFLLCPKVLKKISTVISTSTSITTTTFTSIFTSLSTTATTITTCLGPGAFSYDPSFRCGGAYNI